MRKGHGPTGHLNALSVAISSDVSHHLATALTAKPAVYHLQEHALLSALFSAVNMSSVCLLLRLSITSLLAIVLNRVDG